MAGVGAMGTFPVQLRAVLARADANVSTAGATRLRGGRAVVREGAAGALDVSEGQHGGGVEGRHGPPRADGPADRFAAAVAEDPPAGAARVRRRGLHRAAGVRRPAHGRIAERRARGVSAVRALSAVHARAGAGGSRTAVSHAARIAVSGLFWERSALSFR